MSRTALRLAVVAALLVLGLGKNGALQAAEKADGKLAVSHDFSTTVDPGWRVAKGEWKIVDGAWQGAELPADKHGAVARLPLVFQDASVEFDFRLDGAKAISLSFNDAKGHVCRLSIRPVGFQVAKDDHDHEGPDVRVLLADEKVAFKPGSWYHARVDIAGKKMTASIGDATNPGKTVGGEHEMIAAQKTNFGFTVAGQTASFRNLRVSVSDK